MATKNNARALIVRTTAILSGIAAAALAVYCGLIVYAATTFDGDSLPGPAVLYIVAVAVGLAALLLAGIARILWRKNIRQL